MVYVAPAKGARGVKNGAVKNGNKGNRGRGKEQDAVVSKADLLARLTRQAEEHTRILERERAALGLPRHASPDALPPPQQQQFHQRHPQPQSQHPAAGNARNRRGNYHVFTDQGNKKVFDPRKIPGLGGGDGSSGGGGAGRIPAIVPPEAADLEQAFSQTFPDSPNFYPGRVFAIPGTIPPAPNGPQQPKPDDGTILVAPWGGPPQLPGGGGGSVMPVAAELPPPPIPGQPPWQRGQPSSPGGPGGAAPMGGMGMMPPRMGPNPVGMAVGPGGRPPSGSHGGGLPSAAPGGFDAIAAAADPRVAARIEAEARKEAYRRELEEQIRAKKRAKEAEERRRREEDAAWEARAAAAPQPWDPEARAARRGGGGEPLRDEYGRPVANLRQRGVGVGVPGSPSMAMGSPGREGPGLAHMPPSPLLIPGVGKAGSNGPPGTHLGRLRGEPPWSGGNGGGGGGPFPLPFNGDGGGTGAGPGLPTASSPPSHGHGYGYGPPVPLLSLGAGPGPGGGGGGGACDGPPAAAALLVSPNSIPPVSPGNRRFMAAMNDLIAGPSDEQRRQKEMARQRLQMDLEEQIREKRERQARERAELERQRLKEEADMKAFQDNMAAQRHAEGRHGAPGSALPLSPQQQRSQQRRESSGGSGGGGGGGMDGGRPPLPPRRHGRAGKIIDASWLDAAPPPPPAVAAAPAALPPLSSPPPAGPQMSPHSAAGAGGGVIIRRASAGMADGPRVVQEGGCAVPQSPGAAAAAVMRKAPSHDGVSGGGAVRGGHQVTTLLQQLQEEQSRMREDLARQAAAMEKLANDASRALADRDEAWRELQRVKAVLAGGGGGGGGGGGDNVAAGLLESFSVGTVIVDTHMLPKSANSIPDPLPEPLASEVLRRGGVHGLGRMLDHEVDAGFGAGGPGPLSPLGRGFSPSGGAGDGFGGGLFDGGFGYGDLAALQDPVLNRNVNGARRSGIPLPPGMIPPRVAQRQQQQQQPPQGVPPARIQSVYGYGFESSPKSRYNSFFGLEQADAGGPRAGGGGGGLPLLGPRKAPSLKPPPSPAILRGDHLPSPVKQTRGPHHQQSQPGGARARSGRPHGGGGGPTAAAAAAERPLRGRAASAMPLQSQRRSPPELPPVARPPAAAAAAAAAGRAGARQASRRSLEGLQKVLRRGHEERLLRGPLGLGSDDGSGSTGTTVEYVAEDVPATTQLGVRGPRSREASLPGDTKMMSPGAAADYLGGAGGGGGGGRRAVTRSFYSDSIASYKSLLSRGSLIAAMSTEPVAGEMEGPDRAPPSPGGAEATAAAGGGGGIDSARSQAAEAPTERSGGDDTTTRFDTAISAVSAADAHIVAPQEVPLQRPVRVGRRPSSRQRVPSSSSADGSSPATVAGAASAAVEE